MSEEACDWGAVLERDERDEAIELVASLAGHMVAAMSTADAERRGSDSCLAVGHAGAAVFLAHWSRFANDSLTRCAAITRMNWAIDAAAAAQPQAGLFNGVTGIAWSVREVTAELDLSGAAEICEAIDSGLRHLLATPRSWRFRTDLLTGLTGVGCYMLTLPSGASKIGINSVLRHLEAAVEEAAGSGRTWLSHQNFAGFPSGRWPRDVPYVNLGIAQGLPGIIGFLAIASLHGNESKTAARLLRLAVAALRVHELPPGQVSRYPACAAVGHAATPQAPLWCYGDGGIAIVLLLAARALRDAELEKYARDLAVGANEVRGDEGLDAAICHGTSGRMHLAARLFGYTGDERARDSARYWFRLTAKRLESLRRQKPPKFTLRGRQVEIDGLLRGGGGVGLSLLSLCRECEPTWDLPLVVGSGRLDSSA